MLFMQIFSMGCFIFLFAHVVKMPLFFRSFGFRSVDVRSACSEPIPVTLVLNLTSTFLPSFLFFIFFIFILIIIIISPA